MINRNGKKGPDASDKKKCLERLTINICAKYLAAYLQPDNVNLGCTKERAQLKATEPACSRRNRQPHQLSLPAPSRAQKPCEDLAMAAPYSQHVYNVWRNSGNFF